MNSTKLNQAGKLFVIIGATILLCAMAFLWFGKQTQTIVFEGVPIVNQDGDVEHSAQNETIIIPGFEELVIPPGQTQVPVYLYNPAQNTCYFQISIILNETGKTIYQSKMLGPGHAIHEIELEQSFEEGNYDAIVHYQTFSAYDFSDLNGANMPFKLVVKNE